MPGFSDLLDRVERALGSRTADRLSPDDAIRQLALRGEDALAREVSQQFFGQAERLTARSPAYIPSFPAFTPPRYLGVDVARDEYEGFRTRMVGEWMVGEAPNPPVRTPQRAPAKEPSSTSDIAPGEVIDAEYAALVAELGVSSAAADLENFKALVPRAGLRVYHRAEVQEYLHCKYSVPVGNVSALVHWGWRPLRAIDRGVGRATSTNNGDVQRGAEIYAKPIPYPVLLTVKAVRDACPSAKFFVSDEMQAERIPDPFLLVEVGGEQFVIERWDEPAFRGKA